MSSDNLKTLIGWLVRGGCSLCRLGRQGMNTRICRFGDGVAISAFLLSFPAGAFGGLDSILAPVELTESRPAPQILQPPGAAVDEADLNEAKVDRRVRLSEDLLLASLQDRLSNGIEKEGKLRVSLLKPWEDLVLPTSTWDLEIDSSAGSDLASRMLVKVRVLSDGSPFHHLQLPLKVELWREVPVARRRINRGAAFNPEDFDIRNLDTLSLRYSVVGREVDLSNYELKRTVSENRPLSWEDLTLRPLVRRGQVVSVTVKQGYLQIGMKALALQSGAKGEFITLRNLSSRRDFQAQVEGENEVRVFF